MDFERHLLHNGDCLQLLPTLPEHSIDLILCDLPYGTTGAAWDSPIDLAKLWIEYKRIIKPYHAIILTCSQPFTTVLAHSNLDWLKYELIWVKNRPTNFAHAKNKPMKAHENVLVFSEGSTVHEGQSDRRMPYYPQGVRQRKPQKRNHTGPQLSEAFFTKRKSHGEYYADTTGYPDSLLYFETDQLAYHPTAKPIRLMEHLIRTYSRDTEIVLDNTMGSGSTGIACANTRRRFIGMEIDGGYYQIASERIVEAYRAKPNSFDENGVFCFL